MLNNKLNEERLGGKVDQNQTKFKLLNIHNI
jgi:hypothetical protein